MSSNSILNTYAHAALSAARQNNERSGKKARDLRQIQYQAGSWYRPLRVVITTEVSDRGYNIRFIVTSLESSRPSFLYETVYCGRGQMENFIKDHKTALKSGRTSCHSFSANFVRLMLHSSASVLLHTLRKKALAGTDFAAAQFDTIRLRLLKIGAEVYELKTKLHFVLPSSYPLKDVFAMMYRKIALLA